MQIKGDTMSWIFGNWEWILVVMYIIEKVVKLSPSKKDDVIFDMILKPLFDKVSKKK